MKRNPRPRKPAPMFAAFTPKPEPLFAVGGKYTLIDGANVTIKRIEWIANKWCYFLNKLTPSAILRNVSAITEFEFVDLTSKKAMVAA